MNKSGNFFDNFLDNKSQDITLNEKDIVFEILGSPKGFGREPLEKPVGNYLETTFERRKSAAGIPNESGLKQNRIVGEIKEKINNFLSEFNRYFNEKIFNNYTSHIENLMNEKFKKHVEICNYYDGQIKEMEFLLQGKQKLS